MLVHKNSVHDQIFILHVFIAINRIEQNIFFLQESDFVKEILNTEYPLYMLSAFLWKIALQNCRYWLFLQ